MMIKDFIIKIKNEKELIECQKKLFEKGYTWKNSNKNDILKFKTPIYFFIKNENIFWNDDGFIVQSSSLPKFSYQEFIKM